MALITVFVSLIVGFGSVLATEQMRLSGGSAVDKYADLDIAPVLTGSVSPKAADSNRQSTVAEAMPGTTSTPFAVSGALTSTLTSLPEVEGTDSTASPIAIAVTVTPTEDIQIVAATPSATKGAGDIPVEPTPIPVSVTVRVSVSNAAGSNLRSGPQLDSAVLAVLPYRTEAVALRRTEENQWIQVLIPSLGQVGWLRIDQVETSENIELLSVAVP